MIKRYKRCKCQYQQCTAQHNNLVIETRPVPMVKTNCWTKKGSHYLYYPDGRVELSSSYYSK